MGTVKEFVLAAKITALERELKSLYSTAQLLYYSMADELGQLDETGKNQLEDSGVTLPDFQLDYDSWYSEAHRVIAAVLPDRLADFVAQYKVEKRKDVDFLTYSISDYLLGLRTTFGGSVVADQKAALPKMQRQMAILKAAKSCFNRSLMDITSVLQADLFDTELDQASEMAKRGFFRAGGAIAGVVLEKHLAHVCNVYAIKFRKKNPTLSDFSTSLKENDILDIAKWRFVQHLSDLRNLCDHPKEREPTKEDVTDLVEGVDKVIKTVN